MQPYSPEGFYAAAPSAEALQRGISTGDIFQAMCTKCDEFHDLHVDLGALKGIIPREEAAFGAVKEFSILSRVGKPVSFKVLRIDGQTAVLSRKAAQAEAQSYFLSALRTGDVIPAVVLNPADFGVFCDIGCGCSALMRIDRCCVSRLKSTADLFHTGQNIHVAILDIDDITGRIQLTSRELLGTWEENADTFAQGQTVAGTVRSVMHYGVFVELAPNLSGLAEYREGVGPGDPVSVYIRSIDYEKHKIKLNILQLLHGAGTKTSLPYRITSGHMEMWEYFPGSKAVTYF